MKKILIFLVLVMVIALPINCLAITTIFVDKGFFEAGETDAAITDENLATYVKINTLESRTYTFEPRIISHYFSACDYLALSAELYDTDGNLVYTLAIPKTSDGTGTWLVCPYQTKEISKVVIKNTNTQLYGNLKEFQLYSAPTTPKFLLVTPTDGTTNFIVNNSITFNFSKPVISADYTLKSNNVDVPCKITGLGTTAVKITPNDRFSFSTTYTATLSNVTGATGKTDGVFSTTFTTQQDNMPLEITNIIPPSETGIGNNLTCQIQFNKAALDASTVTADNIYLTNETDDVRLESTIEVSQRSGYAWITLTADTLPNEKTLSVTVSNLKDAIGNALTNATTVTYYTPENPPFILKSITPSNGSINATDEVIKMIFSSPVTLNNFEYVLTNKAGEEITAVPTVIGNTITLIATFESDNEYTLTVKKVINSDGEVLENPVAVTFVTIPKSSDNFLSALIRSIMSIFSNAKTGFLFIVGIAIIMGIIFIVVSWLWRKTKKWVRKS